MKVVWLTASLSCLALLAAPATHASEADNGCPDAAVEALGALVKPESSVVTSACKLWSYDRTTTLAALAYDEGVADQKTVIVAALNKAMKVTAVYKKIVEEGVGDTYGPGSFTLDTAKYDLAPKVRAFGVRFTSFSPGANAANSYSTDYLTLFVQDQKSLRPVFTEYMEYQNALNGLIGFPTGHEFIESGARSISVSRSSTHGYADLIVTDTITYDGNEEDRPPDVKGEGRMEKQVYRYDGVRYGAAVP